MKGQWLDASRVHRQSVTVHWGANLLHVNLSSVIGLMTVRLQA